MSRLSIDQTRWKIPEYSRNEINKSGNAIRREDLSESEGKQAAAVIDNWRSEHAYPSHVFYVNLRGKAGTRSDVLVAERLKRLESIVNKLKLRSGMNLYRMQDIGGCRMVVPTIDEVYQFSDQLQKSQIRHVLIKPHDYIQIPRNLDIDHFTWSIALLQTDHQRMYTIKAKC